MNGWTNWATWNVALWIQNDECLYSIGQECDCYSDFINWMRMVCMDETPDGASFTDPALNTHQLSAMLADLC